MKKGEKNTPVVQPAASAEKNPTVQGGQPPGDDMRRPDDASHGWNIDPFHKDTRQARQGITYTLRFNRSEAKAQAEKKVRLLLNDDVNGARNRKRFDYLSLTPDLGIIQPLAVSRVVVVT